MGPYNQLFVYRTRLQLLGTETSDFLGAPVAAAGPQDCRKLYLFLVLNSLRPYSLTVTVGL